MDDDVARGGESIPPLAAFGLAACIEAAAVREDHHRRLSREGFRIPNEERIGPRELGVDELDPFDDAYVPLVDGVFARFEVGVVAGGPGPATPIVITALPFAASAGSECARRDERP